MADPRPIGVFDSGVGGLTVARAILEDWREASGEFVRVMARAEVALIESALEGTARAGA